MEYVDWERNSHFLKFQKWAQGVNSVLFILIACGAGALGIGLEFDLKPVWIGGIVSLAAAFVLKRIFWVHKL